MALIDKNGWHTSGTPRPYEHDEAQGSAGDLKSYLSDLAKNRLITLASKYKVRVCKTGRKGQIVDTFLCRVPSDMIEPICSELEREQRQRRTSAPVAVVKQPPLQMID